MKRPKRLRLPDGISQGQLETVLSETYAFLAERSAAQSWSVYDTFDRRLFAQSLTLAWSGRDVVLRPVPDGKMLHKLQLSSPPRMANDLQEGDFWRKVAPIIRMRALMEQTLVKSWSCTYHLLNKDQKTVVRLIYTKAYITGSREEPSLISYLTVRPMRGYGKQADRLYMYLKRRLNISTMKEDIYTWALKTAKQIPGSLSGKMDVPLTPGMKAGQAARLILRQMLETIRANEDGVKADIDTEFLHDYRIAVRRTRSALSLLQKVFPAEPTDQFKREFKALGRLTNDLRDLDVHLLAEVDFRTLLPDTMQEDITPLFDALRERRSEALVEVVAGLESEENTRLLEAWETFLHEPVGEYDGGNSSVPIINLAQKRIARQYRSIIRDGSSILKHTEDEPFDSDQDRLLHALRIECKKLRYLLEFFANLYPRKKMSVMVKRLKGLQDNLGEFTDLSVQQGFLLSIAEGLDIDEVRAKRALIATGYLVETLERKRQDVRADFAGTFKKFASPAHQRQFRKVINQEKKVKS